MLPKLWNNFSLSFQRLVSGWSPPEIRHQFHLTYNNSVLLIFNILLVTVILLLLWTALCQLYLITTGHVILVSSGDSSMWHHLQPEHSDTQRVTEVTVQCTSQVTPSHVVRPHSAVRCKTWVTRWTPAVSRVCRPHRHPASVMSQSAVSQQPSMHGTTLTPNQPLQNHFLFPSTPDLIVWSLWWAWKTEKIICVRGGLEVFHCNVNPEDESDVNKCDDDNGSSVYFHLNLHTRL